MIRRVEEMEPSSFAKEFMEFWKNWRISEIVDFWKFVEYGKFVEFRKFVEFGKIVEFYIFKTRQILLVLIMKLFLVRNRCHLLSSLHSLFIMIDVIDEFVALPFTISQQEAHVFDAELPTNRDFIKNLNDQ